ncbi:mediator of RNA polymerase II transcription subunit 30-like isoform X2 [Mytilus galloprovincialis]|uniref:mediator of RNA polymerase II transcription subunit 30-like isoform X2 n=2 Tax=Mytilus galloprovincialis TaxID=29158 RepID=UPI003F7BBBDA
MREEMPFCQFKSLMAAPPSGQYPSMISQTSVPPFSSSGMTQQTSTHQPPQQIVSPTREINAINLCKKGQECVQDVVQKAGEIFKLLQLKSLPLPNGVTMNAQMHQEKRGKLEEGIQQLQQNFMKLRLMYDKANEITGPDEPPEESLVPITGEPFEDRLSPNSEQAFYRSRFYSEENRDQVEQLKMKNKQLKDIIDQMRTVIWEINTMMIMRKT